MKIFFIAIITFLLSNLVYSQQPQDSIFVIINGDTVHIWNTGAYENCACLFRMDVTISNDTIYVTEVDTANTWAFCLCYFDLNTSIAGLQSANYCVEIYRRFLLDPDTLIYVGSTSFNYNGSLLTFASISYQSECYDISSVEGNEEIPEAYKLEQNYPNPFNPNTKISWQSTVSGNQTLKVYDVLGNEVATLVDEYRDAGNYEVEFQSSIGSRQLASGIYFYKLKVGSFVETKKMIYLK